MKAYLTIIGRWFDMKLETYINVRGVSGDMTYGFESNPKTEVDEDFDEYRLRVHDEVNWIFDNIKKSENERNL